MFHVKDGTRFEMNYEVVPQMVPEPVFFIHGNLASNRWWIPAREVWQKKAKEPGRSAPLIFAEFRGCGKSSAPRSPAEVNMWTFAKDFVALVKDLNLGKVHLVGHSTGGLIAALMMTLEPGLFRKAVLLDPVGPVGVKFDNAMIGAFEAMKTDRDLVSTVMNSTIYRNDPQSDFFRQVVIEDAVSSVRVVGHHVLQALDGLDVRKEVASIVSPVLVLHGDQDAILPLADSRLMAEIIPQGQFEVIKNHGHCWNVEDPGAFVNRVEQFLLFA